jgi:Secretion system C-terminal sorting domain
MFKGCSDPHNSPCIDVADSNNYDGILDCAWGLLYSLCDMGAYGGVDSLPVSIGEPISQMPDKFILFDNYPNPFNMTTQIAYELVEPTYVTLDIYDILGQRVSRLVEGRKGPGSYTVNWDASDVSSGIYIYRIHAGKCKRSKNMTLIK